MPRRPKMHALLAELIAMAQKCGDHEAAQAYHASLKEDPVAWASLKLLGYQENDDTTRLELRDCARCGSTLGKKIPI